MVSDREKKHGKEYRMEASGDGKTLLALLQERQIYIDAPCGGMGSCGRCRVIFPEGAPEPTEKEHRLLTEDELAKGVRLACAVTPQKDVTIILPKDVQADIATPGSGKRASSEGKSVSEERPSPEGRLPPEGSGGKYGIAIDIGTTTLAAALVESGSGEIIEVRTTVNRQRMYGADVISRIRAANEGKGELLRELVQADLKQLMEELLTKTGTKPESVEEIAVAGNTVMCHLLRGLSCRTLGEAPFTPVDISLWEGESRELFGEGAIGARAVVLPGVSAFVGADIVAGIYGCEMHRQKSAAFFLDIGTNGEMAVGGKEGFLATSAAAGPVFEGGNLSCGVPGIPGAVTHVRLVQRPGEIRQSVQYETIGGGMPVGLCGTGVIDTLSELVRNRLVDENGMLAEPWFEEGFPVTEAVRLTQRDIREVQMGKSAIRAGIETLAEEYGETIRSAALAGGFGYEMDVRKAVHIGLLPEWFGNHPRLLGNSSLTGAVRFLLEKDARGETAWIASHTSEINLAMHPGFNDRYLQYMFF